MSNATCGTGGWTAVPNRFLDGLASLSPAAIRVYAAIVRQIAGFHREVAGLSVVKLQKLTGAGKGQVIRGIRELLAAGFISIADKTGPRGLRYFRLTGLAVKPVGERDRSRTETGNGLGLTPEPVPNQDRHYKRNSIQTKSEKNSSSPSSEGAELAALLASLIRKNNPKAKTQTKSQVCQWAQDADRMLRLDNRDFADARKLLEWAQRDTFWMSNILSMGAFRKQYDRLTMQRERRGTNEHGTHSGPGAPIPAEIENGTDYGAELRRRTKTLPTM